MAELYIGTSGWDHDDWRGILYPRESKPEEYLLHYSKRFNSAEIKESFLHLPDEQVWKDWVAAVPEGFVFSVKVAKSITHGKKLKGSAGPWKTFLESAQLLGEKLGPLLIQLPPSLKCDIGVLERFLDSVPEARERRLALEARHASWFDPMALYDLSRLGIAAVVADSDRYPEAPHVPTAKFVYLRFHGPGQMFASRYSSEELKPWAERIRKWLDGGRPVYAYFNNDYEGHAVANARMLQRMVAGREASAGRAR